MGYRKLSKNRKMKENKMIKKLAINGGVPVRSKPFPNMTTIGLFEIKAINRVMKSGNLSGYRGNWSENFYGGGEIQALESEWSRYFNVESSIAVNSATSGLQIACGAIGLKPGDEVIVTPWSMSCSATAPLLWGAVPVFADIEENDFCLDPKSVEQKITERTRAIIVVSLFGQPYDPKINEIAKKHGLIVIEDAAQAIGSKFIIGYDEANGEHSAWAGTLGDIGVYSFTQGKHITCGEGGMLVTDNPNFAFNCEMLRNHAEAVENDMYENNQSEWAQMKKIPFLRPGMFGFNLRMTEIQAAIIREQLGQLESIVRAHVRNAEHIAERIQYIPPIKPPMGAREHCTHSYYVQAFKWDMEFSEGVHRDEYINAVKAELAPEAGRENEGVPIGCGYIKPLYLFPIFQKMRDEWFKNPPGSSTCIANRHPDLYKKGSCPVAERLWKEELFLHRLLGISLTKNDLDSIVQAFWKVWAYRHESK
jgi:dTDP-4-amino-4,6-dideoxygalactose transaminase